jgi:hypothetical protein
VNSGTIAVRIPAIPDEMWSSPQVMSTYGMTMLVAPTIPMSSHVPASRGSRAFCQRITIARRAVPRMVRVATRVSGVMPSSRPILMNR